MADRKDSALTSATPVITDAVRGLDDPAGTPISVTFLLSAIYTLFKTSFDAVYAAIGSSGIGVNALINGGFRVAQRGTTFNSTTTPANSDDTFLLDRWNLLSDGNDIVDVSQETSATIADPAYNIKLDVETANKKFGIIQFLEQKDARRLINQSVSLSFKAKITGTTINAIRAAVIAWDGTADTLTSDVVSAWGAAGTNPTLVANWTYENTPAALTAPTTSWASYSIQNIAIDTASAKNVAVFIWTDDATMDVADFLHIADVKLEVGATATAFEQRPYATELALCQRYYETSYANGIIPGTANILGNGAIANVTTALAGSTAGNIAGFNIIPFKVTKRSAPAIILYDYDGTANAVRVYPADAKRAGVTTVAGLVDSGSFQYMGFDNSSGTAIGANANVMFGWTVSAEL